MASNKIKKKRTSGNLSLHGNLVPSNKPDKREPENEAVGMLITTLGSLLVASLMKQPAYIGTPLLVMGLYKKDTEMTIAGTILTSFNIWLKVREKRNQLWKPVEEKSNP